MKYYNIAILGSKAPYLTYKSPLELLQNDVVCVKLKTRYALGVVLEMVKEPSFECKEILQVKNMRFSAMQATLARFISAYYCASFGESFGLFTPFDLDSLECGSYFLGADSNLKPILRESNQKHSFISLSALSQAQNEAFTFLSSRQSALLFGDTGSGKTEIYTHLIAAHLERGESALFLMPEISLTPQMEKRLRGCFGDLVALWHSKLSKKDRQSTLQRIKNGSAKLIAGARSALFLPLPRLGLIVIDEEHDDAYKSQSRPRYNARDVALLASQKCDVRVVLGSATPLATTYYNFAQKGALFRLKGRHFHSVKRLEFVSGLDSLTPFVLDSLQKTLKTGKQAIVFLPTRANFKHLLCEICGAVVQCPNCSVSLSLHKNDRAMKCHHCGFTRRIPEACDMCGAELKAQRAGTAEVASELEEHFQGARIARFDRDLITTESRLKKSLEQFNAGKIDILVGTQMLSKGHDYHNVELVVVLGIDYLLKSDDYRANERALALLLQLSGRSGRRESGRVIIETFHEGFFSQFIDDYEAFIKYELNGRNRLYPPFQKLGLLWFEHKSQERAKSSYLASLELLSTTGIEIIGHGAAPIERLANRWRFLIFARDKSPKKLIQALIYARGELGEIDIDPVAFS
ncbi:MAG: primosomal protein N' [Wolinella sp.]